MLKCLITPICRNLFLRRLSDLEKQMLKDGNVVILSGVRTPVGAFQGSLKQKSAVELGSVVIQQAIKAAGVCSSNIDHVYFGQVLQSGCKQSPARQAALLAGCPNSVDCTLINKVCASSLKAVTLGVQAILSQTDKVVVAGGMESMSNSPFLLSRDAPTYGGFKVEDSIIHDGLICAINDIHMGECCESLAEKHKISRLEQDQYTEASNLRAIEAWKNKVFDDQIVYVPVKNVKTGEIVKVYEDENLKKFNSEKVYLLSPCFKENGTITAANASKLADGASALVLASKDEAKRLALEPIAKIIVHAIRKALATVDININDVSLFEINEAFSLVPLVCMKELGIDHSKVNIHGGAVAIGHPLGASGARILTHLIHALELHQVGVAAICNGGGAATAVVVVKIRP